MNRSRCQSLRNRLLFLLLSAFVLVGNIVVEDTEDSTTSDAASSEKVIEDPSKKRESGSDVVSDVVNEDIDKALESVKEKKTTALRINVMQNGGAELPLKDARVIVIHDDATEYERRTDQAGVALFPALPYGKVDVDVTSSGRESEGGNLVLDEPQEMLTFQLKIRSAAE